MTCQYLKGVGGAGHGVQDLNMPSIELPVSGTLIGT